MDMRPSKMMMTSASLVAIVLASAGSAGAAASTPLAGHVAKWVAKASKVGTADPSQTVKLAAFLGFKNQDQLSRLIAAQSTPGAPEYSHYLTGAQFRAQFAPSAQDEARVEAGLRGLGFTIAGKPTSNLYVEFSGTVAQVKAAFGVSQDLYAFGGKVMRANAEEPSLPASLSGLVAAVVGLDETGQLIHPFHHSINEDSASATAPSARATGRAGPAVTIPVAANLPSPYCSTYFGDTVGTLSTTPAPYAAHVPWLVCAYNPQQMRSAYGADKSTLDGTGVTVAITDAYVSPTLASDANQYSTNHGLPALTGANFQILYGGDLSAVSNSDPCGPQGWFTEISLDVAAVHTMAPGANILYSGGLSCSNVDLDAAVYTVVDGTAEVGGPLADIITDSWGETGEQSSPAEQAVDNAIFQQAAAEGVSILFSSGDSGDVALDIGIADASWPAASPLVTAVGGTSLALKNSSGTKSEWGWGTFRAYLAGATVNSASSITNSGLGSFSFYAGAGGGPSLDWKEPSYQIGTVPSIISHRTYDLNGKRYNLKGDRVAPDVAMDADPYTGFLYGETFTIAGNPVSDAGCTPTVAPLEYCEEGIGGTSLASPLFAGTLAVVDQYRHANGLGDLGFVNPRLYALKVGAPGSTTTPLVDVQAPAAPTAVLRGYVTNPNLIRLVTINSVPGPFGPLCLSSYCNGQDSWILQTASGWDDVTGVGTPYVPVLQMKLGTAP
jgi:subtilase family serine protease